MRRDMRRETCLDDCSNPCHPTRLSRAEAPEPAVVPLYFAFDVRPIHFFFCKVHFRLISLPALLSELKTYKRRTNAQKITPSPTPTSSCVSTIEDQGHGVRVRLR
eukprot:FR741458.1.p3 GENE.FR741458.1~~FR741458.1.p3  ORF type:complete len:105 (-),score=4.64 FR741458.1:26-340(-)